MGSKLLRAVGAQEKLRDKVCRGSRLPYAMCLSLHVHPSRGGIPRLGVSCNGIVHVLDLGGEEFNLGLVLVCQPDRIKVGLPSLCDLCLRCCTGCPSFVLARLCTRKTLFQRPQLLGKRFGAMCVVL